MARIRSVHPGLATDESFVSVSMEARVFFVLLQGECDDGGAFEWKPLQLKMRLMPADAVDIVSLLSELQAADMLKSYEVGGKEYGAVRNFGNHQRPKKPNRSHPMPSDVRTYAATTALGSEPTEDEDGGGSPPVPHQGDSGSRKSPQMEKEKEKEKEKEREREKEGELALSNGRERPARPSVPDWVPPVAWNGYLEMRRKQRKPPTDHAIELLLSKLDGFRQRGVNLAEALDQSTVSGWTDVYEPKTSTRAGAAPKSRFEAWDAIGQHIERSAH